MRRRRDGFALTDPQFQPVRIVGQRNVTRKIEHDNLAPILAVGDRGTQ
jgi:hypothetical protein